MTKTINTNVYDLFAQVGNPDGWNSINHQQDNFAKILQLAQLCDHSLIGSSVLDVGCGTGKLYEFLQQHQIKKYVGVDVYRPSLEIAHQTYPQAQFLEQNILEPSLELYTSFDYVFCSGALTTRVEENTDFLQRMVLRMDQLAEYGVYFNFLTQVHKDVADLLYPYDPSVIREICEKAGKRLQLSQNGERQEGQAL